MYGPFLTIYGPVCDITRLLVFLAREERHLLAKLCAKQYNASVKIKHDVVLVILSFILTYTSRAVTRLL